MRPGRPFPGGGISRKIRNDRSVYGHLNALHLYRGVLCVTFKMHQIQGRCDGPKADASGASEAARASPSSHQPQESGVIFYPQENFEILNATLTCDLVHRPMFQGLK